MRLLLAAALLFVVAACEIEPPEPTTPPTLTGDELATLIAPPDVGAWTWGEWKGYTWVQVPADDLDGEVGAENGFLTLKCSHGYLLTEAWLVFYPIAGFESGMSTATAVGKVTEYLNYVRGAVKSDVFIARRDAGTSGRWEKIGWDSTVTAAGNLELWKVPAVAFIRELGEVEEVALLLTTDDFPKLVTATFDVRHLRAALGAAEWEC